MIQTYNTIGSEIDLNEGRILQAIVFLVQPAKAIKFQVFDHEI